MTKFYNYINEKLIKINDKDINMLYEPLKPYIATINTVINGLSKIERRKRTNINWNELIKEITKKETLEKDINVFFSNTQQRKIDVFSSSDLISKKAEMADKLNPITIYILTKVNNNCYRPTTKEIYIGIPKQYLSIIFDQDMSFSLDSEIKRFKNEFSEERMKSTIRHELTHWIDDTLHNRYIENLVKKSQQTMNPEILKQGHSIINLTDHEINAIINQLDQVRKSVGKNVWNKITWDDLETMIASVYSKILSSEVGYEFRKKLKKRMAREKILGKNMR